MIEFIHEEIIKDALTLIHHKKYKGAEQEFLSAHEHYRHSRHKESLNEALKAFESVMKCICADNRWSVPQKATASSLLKTIFENELIQSELQSHFAGIRSALESGVPTVRNNESGHGQGLAVKTVPGWVVAFMLHSTASAIIFMVSANEKKNDP